MAADEVLTMEEICDLLQVHKSTVYKLVRRAAFRVFESVAIGDSEGT